MFLFLSLVVCFLASSDKKRKLETKQEPKQSKKLKKRENNRKDTKLKRKK